MKKLIFLLAVMAALPAMAKQRTTDEVAAAARQVLATTPAGRRAPAGRPLQLMQRGSEYTIMGYADGGFAVIANDDAFPAVLGYSDTPFAADGNPGFGWWLTAMNETMESGKGAAVYKTVAPDPSKYAPQVDAMVTAQWGQETPFNNLCPLVSGSQTAHCVTGCEATALAQILYYHRQPISGQGSRTIYYPWGDRNGEALTADFSQASYDYAAMRDSYTGNGTYTQQEADAVAQLMLDCGILANMVYDPSASSAFNFDVAHGLKKYLGMPQATRILYRDYFSEADWMDFIYADLNKGLPILYTGVDAYAGGHAFVIDGYNADGLVHVNWGWTGRENGFFNVALLNPRSPSRQFEYSQNMIIGINPGSTETLREEEVTVATAGTLETVLSGKDPLTISRLKVSGTINGKDIGYLRYMMGCDGSTRMTSGILSRLDLTDARIVKGGGVFLNVSGFKYEAANDDELPQMAFYDCEQLSELLLPSSLKSFGSGALAQCCGLDRVVLPEGADKNYTVSDGVVYNADKTVVLQCLPTKELAVNVAAGAKEVGSYAFLGNSSLSEVTLPASIERIGDLAFYNSTNIRKLHIRSSQPPTNGYYPYSGLERNCLLYVPTGTKATYAANAAYSLFNSYGNIVEEDACPKHRVLLEEYTGTWCGWCPSGYVGLERMNELCPDDVICVSYHNEDPMAFLKQADLPWDAATLGTFTGFPSAALDRVKKTHAYCGDLADGEFGIDQACLARAAADAPADIEVEARFADDDPTKIEVSTAVVFADNVSGQPYELSYILLANGLTGNGSGWAQNNYFGSEGSTWTNDDMRAFTEGGSKVPGLTYNFVAVAWSGIYGVLGSIASNAQAHTRNTHSYVFDLNQADPSKGVKASDLIQDNSQLDVVALLVNKRTGEVLNAAKAHVAEAKTNGISAATGTAATDSRPTAVYSLTGKRLSTPQKGINIVRLSNGKTIKTVVK